MVIMGCNRKCQVSVESAIAVGIVFMILILLLFFAYQINDEKRNAGSAAELENECARLSSLASGVHAAGTGSVANMTLQHNVTVEQGATIFAESDDAEVSCRSRVPLTNSTSQTFMISRGKISIRNNGGLVMLESIE